MKLNTILLTIIFLYSNCHGASKALVLKPSKWTMSYAQAASDAQKKHKVAQFSSKNNPSASTATAANSKPKQVQLSERDKKHQASHAMSALVQTQTRPKASAQQQTAAAYSLKTWAQKGLSKTAFIQMTDVTGQKNNVKTPDMWETKTPKYNIFEDEYVIIEVLNDKKECVRVINLKISPGKLCFLHTVVLRNDILALYHSDASVSTWDFTKQEEECLATFHGFAKSHDSMFQLKDGRLVGWIENRIHITDVYSKNPISILSAHKHNVSSVIELEDGRLVSCDENGYVFIWDLSKSKIEVKCLAKIGDRSGFKSILIKLDKGKIAVGHLWTVKVFDLTKEIDHALVSSHSTTHQRLSNNCTLGSIFRIEKLSDHELLIYYHAPGSCVPIREKWNWDKQLVQFLGIG